MGIFNLTDFKFNTDKTNQSGPLDSLIDGPSKYAYDVYKYPIDLGNYDKGHYIVFHINEQVKTNFPGTQTNVTQPSQQAKRVCLIGVLVLQQLAD